MIKKYILFLQSLWGSLGQISLHHWVWSLSKYYHSFHISWHFIIPNFSLHQVKQMIVVLKENTNSMQNKTFMMNFWTYFGSNFNILNTLFLLIVKVSKNMFNHTNMSHKYWSVSIIGFPKWRKSLTPSSIVVKVIKHSKTDSSWYVSYNAF